MFDGLEIEREFADLHSKMLKCGTRGKLVIVATLDSKTKTISIRLKLKDRTGRRFPRRDWLRQPGLRHNQEDLPTIPCPRSAIPDGRYEYSGRRTPRSSPPYSQDGSNSDRNSRPWLFDSSSNTKMRISSIALGASVLADPVLGQINAFTWRFSGGVVSGVILFPLFYRFRSTLGSRRLQSTAMWEC